MKTIQKYLGFIVIFSAIGCGQQGFKVQTFDSVSETAAQSDSSSSQNGEVNPPKNSEDHLYDQINLKASVDSLEHTGLIAVDLDKANNTLILTAPLLLNMFVEPTVGSFPGFDKIKYEVVQDSEGSKMTVTIPLVYILKGLKSQNPSKLPSGDPLPSIPGGELPSLALSLGKEKKVQLIVYIGVQVAAFFISSPIDPHFNMTAPIKDEARRKVVGYLSTIKEKNHFNGGIFLSYQLPPEVAAYLDDHF